MLTLSRGRAISSRGARGRATDPLQRATTFQRRAPSVAGLRRVPARGRSVLAQQPALGYMRSVAPFPDSSAVEQSTVNRLVAGSNPAPGASRWRKLLRQLHKSHSKRRLPHHLSHRDDAKRDVRRALRGRIPPAGTLRGRSLGKARRRSAAARRAARAATAPRASLRSRLRTVLSLALLALLIGREERSGLAIRGTKHSPLSGCHLPAVAQ